MNQTSVADLSVDQFRDLVRETVAQTVVELLEDPDEGLELRDDIKARLQRSIAAVEAGGETIPAEVVAARIGMAW